MKNLAAAVFGILSVVALGIGLLLGAFLIVSPSGGGFFPGLGMTLGIVVIGAGNLVSCLCNGFCWWLGKGPRWLAYLVLLQSLPAALAAAAIIGEIIV